MNLYEMLFNRDERLIEMIREQHKKIIKIIELVNKYESIRAYYSYEENGYEEYNYDEDFKNELLDILRGEE